MSALVAGCSTVEELIFDNTPAEAALLGITRTSEGFSAVTVPCGGDTSVTIALTEAPGDPSEPVVLWQAGSGEADRWITPLPQLEEIVADRPADVVFTFVAQAPDTLTAWELDVTRVQLDSLAEGDVLTFDISGFPFPTVTRSFDDFLTDAIEYCG